MTYTKKPVTDLTVEELLTLPGKPVYLGIRLKDEPGLYMQTVGTFVNMSQSLVEPSKVLISFMDGEKTTEVSWDPDQHDAEIVWQDE